MTLAILPPPTGTWFSSDWNGKKESETLVALNRTGERYWPVLQCSTHRTYLALTGLWEAFGDDSERKPRGLCQFTSSHTRRPTYSLHVSVHRSRDFISCLETPTLCVIKSSQIFPVIYRSSFLVLQGHYGSWKHAGLPYRMQEGLHKRRQSMKIKGEGEKWHLSKFNHELVLNVLPMKMLINVSQTSCQIPNACLWVVWRA